MLLLGKMLCEGMCVDGWIWDFVVFENWTRKCLEVRYTLLYKLQEASR